MSEFSSENKRFPEGEPQNPAEKAEMRKECTEKSEKLRPAGRIHVSQPKPMYRANSLDIGADLTAWDSFVVTSPPTQRGEVEVRTPLEKVAEKSTEEENSPQNENVAQTAEITPQETPSSAFIEEEKIPTNVPIVGATTDEMQLTVAKVLAEHQEAQERIIAEADRKRQAELAQKQAEEEAKAQQIAKAEQERKAIIARHRAEQEAKAAQKKTEEEAEVSQIVELAHNPEKRSTVPETVQEEVTVSGEEDTWLVRYLIRVGETVSNWLFTIGDFAMFVMSVFRWLVRGTRRGTLLPCMYEIGIMSLPVIALTGSFIGMVLAVQSYNQLKGFYLETRMGALINLSLVRELGPVLAATMLAGRIGSSMAAELGTMRVTEQIDALGSMGVNPIHYLVVPRFLGCVLLIPILTIFADFMGIVGGAYFSVWIYNIDWHFYLANSNKIVGEVDVFIGVFKSFFFGATIGLIGCHRGFNSRAGAQGVGRAATEAFVFSFVFILLLDLALGTIFEALSDVLFTPMPRQL